MRKLVERLFPLGRRSLLFGVHQFLWHPITVWRAWCRQYKRYPTWRETVCIIIHDWGYWFTSDMDGEAGERHPEVGARLAGRMLGQEYHDLVLYHSRHYARAQGKLPSPLCWADKASILFDPPWWYLFRARLSGELVEYRERAAAAGVVPLSAPDSEWFRVIREKFQRLAEAQDPTVVTYMGRF